MEAKEIIEGDEIIADFMNLKPLDWKNSFNNVPMRIWIDKETDQAIYPEAELRYHSSWDWIMPVVEKISSTVIVGHPPFNSDQFVKVEIVLSGYVRIGNIRGTPIITNVSREGNLIMAVWRAVVQFIKWYNTNTQNQK